MQTPRRYAPMGGSFAPVRVAAFKWNGWQASAVYAFDESQQTYGSPRIHAALKRQGEIIGKRRVERLMREQGIRACSATWSRRSRDMRRFFGRVKNQVHELEVTGTDQVWVSELSATR